MESMSWYQGSTAVMWRQEEVWQIKGMTKYGPNVVSFMLTMGWKRWYVVGEYIPPNDQSSVRRVEQALAYFPM